MAKILIDFKCERCFLYFFASVFGLKYIISFRICFETNVESAFVGKIICKISRKNLLLVFQTEKYVFLLRFLWRFFAVDRKKHEALCSSCSWEREKFRIMMQEGVIVRAVLAWTDYYIPHYKVILTTSS